MANMMDVTKQLAISAAMVILVAGVAHGADARASVPTDGPASSPVSSPVSLAEAASHARFATVRRQAQPTPADDLDEKGTWDNIKRGFYAGLVVGGLVGVVMVAECGHPECGPLLPFAAGVGGAIGLGLDALVDRFHDVAGESAQRAARRPTPAAGPRVTLRFRKRW
jgi:hypothetical protein